MAEKHIRSQRMTVAARSADAPLDTSCSNHKNREKTRGFMCQMQYGWGGSDGERTSQC